MELFESVLQCSKKAGLFQGTISLLNAFSMACAAAQIICSIHAELYVQSQGLVHSCFMRSHVQKKNEQAPIADIRVLAGVELSALDLKTGSP